MIYSLYKKSILIITIILFASSYLGCKQKKKIKASAEEKTTNTYQENWESLSKHNEAPDWFQDAKFGIYFHWGVYSVPAFGDEWYPRRMHFEADTVYKHHLKTYGHPSEFGYHDFVPMFKAEKFDAEVWSELFQKAGAKFAGPVAEHHDGFAMWNSKASPWNSVNKGPKQDITGALKKSITSRGMKFITTFHHAKHLQRSSTLNQENRLSHYPYFENMPPSIYENDPELKYLYGNIDPDEWHENIWFGKLKEVIDQYQPDIIWFDSWLDQIPEAYRQKFAAYYLNQAKKWHREVVIVRKQDDLPLDFSVDDLEKSRKNVLEEKVWMTDETLSTGSWSYTEDMEIKSGKDILHVLIDIVSKNGVLLLNISPKADGSIPINQQESLLAMGKWLDQFGEAIYATRPWHVFGEGPTKEPEGHFKNRNEFLKLKYSTKDIRYTTKKNTIYAIVLGQTRTNQNILLKSFSKKYLKNSSTKIKTLSFLGSEQAINWSLNDEGLQIIAPEKPTNSLATVIKITVSK